MAQQHHDLAAQPAAGDVLTAYLQDRATEFLRSLRLHREHGGAGGGDETADAARALRRAARRISGTLHTFRPLLDPEWSDALRPELAWLSGTLAREHAYAARAERLLAALQRLSGTGPLATTAVARTPQAHPAAAVGRPQPAVVGSRSAEAERVGTTDRAPGKAPQPPTQGPLAVGAAKAAALLERQLTLARTRAHSAALQALGSSRFHAVADNVALLASEVPLAPKATTADLKPLAAEAESRLTDAVSALPLLRAGHPYNADALVHGLAPDPSPQSQDSPWHQVRLLLRLHRYAREVLLGPDDVDECLLTAGQALDRHRDAAEAAAATASAARTPRIAPATAYALGVLHADQRHEVEAARYAFQQLWMREAVSTS